VIKRIGLPPRPTQPPPRTVDFDLNHIPQYLPTDWYETYFATIDSDERWLRRAVPVLLARMRLGGSVRRAAALLGLPWSAGRFAVAAVADQLRDHPTQQAAFDAALEALAEHQHTAVHRVDYGARSEALAAWSLSPDQRRDMTSGLVRIYRGKGYRQIDWADRKRLLASVWIWTHVTAGEHWPASATRRSPVPTSTLSSWSSAKVRSWVGTGLSLLVMNSCRGVAPAGRTAGWRAPHPGTARDPTVR
jgi:hypothetical protein